MAAGENHPLWRECFNFGSNSTSGALHYYLTEIVVGFQYSITEQLQMVLSNAWILRITIRNPVLGYW